MDNPQLALLSRTTRRLTGEREGCDIDVERVLLRARERGCAIDRTSRNTQRSGVSLSTSTLRSSSRNGGRNHLGTPGEIKSEWWATSSRIRGRHPSESSLGVSGKKLFLLRVFRRRLEYPALKRAVREQQSLFGATVVLIEDKASGTKLVQELITDG